MAIRFANLTKMERTSILFKLGAHESFNLRIILEAKLLILPALILKKQKRQTENMRTKTLGVRAMNSPQVTGIIGEPF